MLVIFLGFYLYIAIFFLQLFEHSVCHPGKKWRVWENIFQYGTVSPGLMWQCIWAHPQ